MYIILHEDYMNCCKGIEHVELISTRVSIVSYWGFLICALNGNFTFMRVFYDTGYRSKKS